MAQIAEPDHGVDTLAVTPFDKPVEDTPAGVSAEIGFDEGPGSAAQGMDFEQARQHRQHAGDSLQFDLAETAGAIGGQGQGIDPAVLEKKWQGHVIGAALRHQVLSDKCELVSVWQ